MLKTEGVCGLDKWRQDYSWSHHGFGPFTASYKKKNLLACEWTGTRWMEFSKAQEHWSTIRWAFHKPRACGRDGVWASVCADFMIVSIFVGVSNGPCYARCALCAAVFLTQTYNCLHWPPVLKPSGLIFEWTSSRQAFCLTPNRKPLNENRFASIRTLFLREWNNLWFYLSEMSSKHSLCKQKF